MNTGSAGGPEEPQPDGPEQRARPRSNSAYWDIPPRKENKGWMIAYMDTVTLLVALFVLLLSQARFDAAQFEKMVDALRLDKYSQAELIGLPPRQLPAQSSTSPAPPTDPSVFASNLRREFAAQGLENLIAVRSDRRNVEIALNESLLFPTGRAEMMRSGQQALAQLLDTLAGAPVNIAVEGHSDDRPIATQQFPSNWELSAARAAAVARQLIQSGIPAEKVHIRAYASTQPVADNATAQGRRANRRVNLRLQFADVPELPDDNAQ